MSQHDYVLDNASGATFRGDANSALAAIVSNNSAATEPATMFAYQWWADTTTGLLKIRNAANSAWVTVGTLATSGLGLITGPTTPTDGGLPLFDGTTGRLIKQATLTQHNVLTAGASNTLSSVAPGSAGNTLYSDGTDWTSSSLLNTNVTAVKTATYAITATDNLIRGDVSGGAFTTTLPTAVGITGKIYKIKRVDQTLGTAFTIATTSSQTIDGATTRKLMTQYEQITVQSDGANWQVVNHTYPQGWVAYTPTFTSFGTTPTSVVFNWRRVGDSASIVGYFKPAATIAAAICSLTIPSGLTIASTLGDANNTMILGTWAWSTQSGTPAALASGNNLGYIFPSRGNSTTDVYFANRGGSATLERRQADGITTAGDGMHVEFTVPITNWEA